MGPLTQWLVKAIVSTKLRESCALYATPIGAKIGRTEGSSAAARLDFACQLITQSPSRPKFMPGKMLPEVAAANRADLGRLRREERQPRSSQATKGGASSSS